ncbi:MAG: hypothetical protein HRU37_06455, partial [Roseibacillus sp.]|nr:hypothetical protein [Roseibacillus sp.]
FGVNSLSPWAWMFLFGHLVWATGFMFPSGDEARSIEDKIEEFGALPEVVLSAEEVEEVRVAGDNTGCMLLKGASQRHKRSERPDEWPMRAELLKLADRYGLGAEW